MKHSVFTKKKQREQKSFFNKILDAIYWFKNLSILKHILFFYLFITIIGSVFLYLPISIQKSEQGHIHYVDSLFIAASSFSDTGLNTITISAEYNYLGQAIIAILIIIGGVGWFALKAYIFNILLNRPIPLGTRLALAQERGSTKIGSTSKLIKVSVTAMIIATLIGAFILSFYFYYVKGNFENPVIWLYPKSNFDFQNNHWGFIDAGGHFRNNDEFDPAGNWNNAIRFGFFHSITGINNAGFDIMGAHSLAPYYGNYFLQIILMALLVFGGIGFPVIYDLYGWSKARFLDNNKPFKFSLFTKLSCYTYLIITIFGLSVSYIIELNTHITSTNSISVWRSPQFGTTSDRIMAIFFNTISTRNAGFSTINYQGFNDGTILTHSILMFIGSAPSSTGGGVRTTTIAIVWLTIWKYIKNKSSVRAFNRKINVETVKRSIVVIAISLLLCIFSTVVMISSFQTNGGKAPVGHGVGIFDMNDVFFEVCSAFGTTGLSTGLTPYLNTVSKLLLILIMFIGQLSISSTLLVWGNKKTTSRHFSYYTENIATG